MKRIYQKLKPLFQDLKQIIYFLFSYEGKLNVAKFIVALLIIRALFHPFGAQIKYSALFSYILDLASFYCVIAAVQKRCRDFSSKGTFAILATSFAFITNEACHFINTQQTENLWKNIDFITSCGLVMVFLPLILLPSNPDADKKLRSPLLKYPLLYVSICWALAIVATLIVNQYASIQIPLF